MMTIPQFAEALLVGISLAMDALAVSLVLGTVERNAFTWRKIAATALCFGAFQMGMPLLGWSIASLGTHIVQHIGKYIAAVLLIGLGSKMLWEARKCKLSGTEEIRGFRIGRLLILAFATSIDALLIGIGYACLQRTGILPDTAIIGIVTLLICTAGCIAGKKLSRNTCHNRFELLGGLVLVGLGVKALIFG
jgi:putative Mn2+ efflux pump MntP